MCKTHGEITHHETVWTTQNST